MTSRFVMLQYFFAEGVRDGLNRGRVFGVEVLVLHRLPFLELPREGDFLAPEEHGRHPRRGGTERGRPIWGAACF